MSSERPAEGSFDGCWPRRRTWAGLRAPCKATLEPCWEQTLIMMKRTKRRSRLVWLSQLQSVFRVSQVGIN